MTIYISLGQNCYIKQELRDYLPKQGYHNKLKNSFESLPFDWVVTRNIKSILDLLENNFKDYISKKEYLEIIEGTNEGSHPGVKNTKYNVDFMHDFDYNRSRRIFNKDMSEIIEMYRRRINRLYTKINNAKKVYFLRWHNGKDFDNSHTYEEICKRLKKIFPNVNFEFHLWYNVEDTKNGIINILNLN